MSEHAFDEWIECNQCGRPCSVYVMGENTAPPGPLCLDCSPSFVALRDQAEARRSDHLCHDCDICNRQRCGLSRAGVEAALRRLDAYRGLLRRAIPALASVNLNERMGLRKTIRSTLVDEGER